MTRPARKEHPELLKPGVTLTALFNNIAVKFGHLSLDVEQAFTDWLHTEGFQDFLEWLKGREMDE